MALVRACRQPFRDARHQNVVIDSIEKFEIQVDHDVVAFGDIALRLGHGLMDGTPRADSVAGRRG